MMYLWPLILVLFSTSAVEAVQCQAITSNWQTSSIIDGDTIELSNGERVQYIDRQARDVSAYLY
ncbi:MAG: hypothetical protein HZA70_03375 [Planctomycetes bacterium]|nr:hypothetical protein [Planctomycetota bacterium]